MNPLTFSKMPNSLMHDSHYDGRPMTIYKPESLFYFFFPRIAKQEMDVDQIHSIVTISCKFGGQATAVCPFSPRKGQSHNKPILMFNPLPDMPILGSSNSTENKDMMAKI